MSVNFDRDVGYNTLYLMSLNEMWVVCAQNLLMILGSIAKMIIEEEQNQAHFDNE
jgi:hypothetical protein